VQKVGGIAAPTPNDATRSHMMHRKEEYILGKRKLLRAGKTYAQRGKDE